MSICEIAESCIAIDPPVGYMAPPHGLLNVLLSMIVTITLMGFIRIIEIRHKPSKLKHKVYTISRFISRKTK